MLELLRADNPHFDRNAVVTLVACVLLAALFVYVLRRLSALDTLAARAREGSWPTPEQLRVSRAPEWLAALCVIVTSAAHAQAIAAVRALFPKLPPPALEPGELAQRLAKSLSGQLNATAMTNLALPPVIFAGLLVIAFAVCARQRALGLWTGARLAQAGDAAAARVWFAHPGPDALATAATLLVPAALTLLPIWHGIHQFVSHFLIALGRTSNLPPGSDRAAFLSEAAVGYRALIEPALAQALIGLAVGAVFAFVLLIRFDPARARGALVQHAAPAPSHATTWIMAGVLLAASALLVQNTLPMRAENRLPWPRHNAGDMRLVLNIITPPLEPSDRAEIAPVLTIDGERLVLDGRPLDLSELEQDLGTLKRNWMTLHPDQTSVGGLIVACSPKTPSTLIADALRTAYVNGYPTAWLAFGRVIEHERPLLGTLRVARSSFARTELGSEADGASGDGGALTIAAASYEDCAALTSAIVQARTREHRVRLLGR